jgi:hypothetical protein
MPVPAASCAAGSATAFPPQHLAHTAAAAVLLLLLLRAACARTCARTLPTCRIFKAVEWALPRALVRVKGYDMYITVFYIIAAVVLGTLVLTACVAVLLKGSDSVNPWLKRCARPAWPLCDVQAAGHNSMLATTSCTRLVLQVDYDPAAGSIGGVLCSLSHRPGHQLLPSGLPVDRHVSGTASEARILHRTKCVCACCRAQLAGIAEHTTQQQE